MNISMNIECSPEEARRFMGLPDLTPVHDLYLDKLREMMASGVTPDFVEQLVRGWSPMGEAGMNAWKQMLDQLAGKSQG